MPASVTSPADVLNISLRNIGYALRVGSLLDGSKAASAALDVYAQTRDDMLRDGEWAFCERNIAATTLKSAPAGGYFDTPWSAATHPPWPWLYSYTYPTDCLKVRMIKPQPGFMLNMTPLPTNYSVVNDNGYATPLRVIVGNLQDPILTYAGQVTSPADWPPDFIDALAAALGTRLKRALAEGDINSADLGITAQATNQAMAEQG